MRHEIMQTDRRCRDNISRIFRLMGAQGED